MHSKFILAAALLTGAASSLSAQTTVTPFVGALLPMKSLLLDTAGSSGFRMQAHSVYGVHFSKSMSPALALDLALGAGDGTLQVVSTEVLDLKTTVYFADLRARFRLAGDEDTQLGAILGAGWTQYSSGLFDAAHEGDEDTYLAGRATGLLGLAFRARLGGRLTLYADAVDRIHEQSIEASSITGVTDPLQHDVTISAGLSFPLGR